MRKKKVSDEIIENQVIQEHKETINVLTYSEEEYLEMKNKYLLALADSENIKKNFRKKESDLYMYQYERLIKELIEVVDDNDRVMKNDAEITPGITLTINKFNNILKKFGVSRMTPEKGEDFSADTMEAVSVFPMGEDFVNKVVDCTQCGFSYNGKILRYPKVVVGQ